MADLTSSIETARAALEKVVRTSDQPIAESRAQDLAKALSQHLDNLVVKPHGLRDTAASELDNLAQAMKRAAAHEDYASVLHHGAALVGSLPGDIQGGMKPPEPRRKGGG